MQLELGQRLAEEELAGKAETVHRPLTVLADEHLVEVRLQNLLLVVVQFQQQRHHGFGELASQAALVGQVEVLDQLLGQRTTALAHMARGGVDPDGPGNRLGRDAEVMVEVAVFDGDQRVEQERRHLVDLDQDPIFEVLGVQATNEQWLKAHHRQTRVVRAGQRSHVVAGKTHPHRLCLFHAFIELEATGVEVDGIAIDRGRTRTIGHAFTAITQGIELGQEVVLAQLLSDEQLQRPGIDLGRDGPALAGELLLDHGIEIDRKTGEHDEAH